MVEETSMEDNFEGKQKNNKKLIPNTSSNNYALPEEQRRKSPRYYQLLVLGITLGVIICVNFISAFKFGRFDLTEDKLHTLSDQTVALIDNEISDVISIEIYLDGDLPAFLQKLKNSIEEKIQEMQANGGVKIKYRFSNPADDINNQEAIKQLQDAGIFQNLAQGVEDGKEITMPIWPGCLVRYGQKQEAIQFLQPGAMITPYDIEPAINEIEFQFVRAIWKLTHENRETVSFLRGHNELNNAELYWIREELFKFYNTDTVRILQKQENDSVFRENLAALDKTDLLIVAKPKKEISEKELFVIDQFLMNGGKIIWMIDRLQIIDDSLKVKPFFKTQPYNNLINLEKMLYKYGVLMNTDIISDIHAGPTFNVNKNKVIPHWYPYVLAGKPNSELTKNVRDIRLKYPNSLTLNHGAKVNKTIILESSENFKKLPAITRIGYDFIDSYNPQLVEKSDTAQKATLGVLLEGNFESYFKGKNISQGFQQFLTESGYAYRDSSKTTSIAVIGDGDLIRNELLYRNGRILPYKLWAEPIYNAPVRSYGNETYFMNLVDKMLGNDYMIPLRSRMQTIRALNDHEVDNRRSYWQIVNTALPIGIIIIFGLTQWFIRKRKFA